jgi:UDP-GlcNAc:undecaprenyl-phosphate GlcNAc-1-phosphate transferase
MQASAILQHLGFALLLALLSAGTVRLMIAFPILDHPNHRSAHARPTPRGGGVGVVVAFWRGWQCCISAPALPASRRRSSSA